MIDDPLLPPVGVLPIDDRTATWRVWAPKAERAELVLGMGERAQHLVMRAEDRGYHAIEAPLPDPGDRYAYRLDAGEPLPDPLSRWQPGGVFEPSAVWFPERFSWDEGSWRGIARREELVFYELNVATFTPEGTFDAVIPRIVELLDLGVTAIELMPIGQFSGRWGWGYDGVFPFAVQNTYGGPEGLQRLVEACHRKGMAVVIDLVINHFGPEGNVFPHFGHYFNPRYNTDWGPALNFDGNHCDPVRQMVLDLVRMWVRDYRCDGIRIDAADQIFDRSPRHILAEVAEVAHSEARRLGRSCHLFAETDMNDAGRFLAPPERCGYGLDGHWNDDFHHAAHVALTGDTTGYYADFSGGIVAVAKVLEAVFVNNGNYSPFRDRRHGAPATEFPGDRFVAFVQNHDQVANGNASRRSADILPPSASRLAAGLLLLAPRLPLLFMGEEYGETNMFPYICDYRSDELREAVRKGRQEEFAYFGREQEPPDPVAEETRDMAVLSWSWDDPFRSGLRRLYRDLLRLRRESPTLRDFRHARTRILEGGHVLEVLRGGEAPGASPELRIYLNFSGEDQPLPAELAAERPSFRSEVEPYASEAAEADRRFTRLRPHEFAVFGPLQPS